MTRFVFPLVFYFLALMALCIEFLPPSALAIFGGRVEGNSLVLTLSVVVVSLLIGASLHFVLYRMDPDRFETALMVKVGGIMALTMAVAFTVSAVLDGTTDASPAELKSRTNSILLWLGLGTVGVVLGLMAIGFVGIVLSIRYHPLNRMTRRIQVEDFDTAIAIGERALRKSDNVAIEFNLAIASLGLGQKERAQSIYDKLVDLDETPAPFSEEAFEQAIQLLKEKLAVEGDGSSN